jgi:hypothetical protein
MPGDDPGIERLRAALAELTAGDAADLLAEARVHARERVRQILVDAMVDSMLDGVRHTLEGRSAAPARTDPKPAPRVEPAPPSAPEVGWYVYGVIGAEAAPAWTLPGVDPGSDVSTLTEGSLAAVVSRVAFEDFGEAKLREHLADMAWVEATARAHEGVLEQTRAQVTVIPMRMCTVYRSEERVREMLRREAAAFTDALAHLEGKTEMGVKVFVTAVPATQREPEPELEGPGAGAAYMERRRRDRDREEEAAQRVEHAVEEIHSRLRARAADAVLAPPQRPEASGRPGEMVLNGVYLVDDDSLDGFGSEVSALSEAFAGEGLELELTGPWPAYNFVPGTMGAAW